MSLAIKNLQRSDSVDDHIILERDKEIKELNQELTDLHEIFEDFSTMVQSQNDPIAQLSQNVNAANMDVERGNIELEKARSYQSSYIKKGLVVGAILLAGVNIPVGLLFGAKVAASFLGISCVGGASVFALLK